MLLPEYDDIQDAHTKSMILLKTIVQVLIYIFFLKKQHIIIQNTHSLCPSPSFMYF